MSIAKARRTRNHSSKDFQPYRAGRVKITHPDGRVTYQESKTAAELRKILKKAER